MAKAGKRVYNEADYEPTKSKRSKLSKLDRQPTQMRDEHDSEEDRGYLTSVKNLAATKEPAKRSRAAVANFESTIEEAKKKLAKSLVEKASAVYACCIFAIWMTFD